MARCGKGSVSRLNVRMCSAYVFPPVFPLNHHSSCGHFLSNTSFPSNNPLIAFSVISKNYHFLFDCILKWKGVVYHKVLRTFGAHG